MTSSRSEMSSGAITAGATYRPGRMLRRPIRIAARSPINREPSTSGSHLRVERSPSYDRKSLQAGSDIFDDVV